MMNTDEMPALYNMEHAFYQMLSIVDDNMPDCGDDEFVEDCRNNYSYAKEEFEKNFGILKKSFTE